MPRLDRMLPQPLPAEIQLPLDGLFPVPSAAARCGSELPDRNRSALVSRHPNRAGVGDPGQRPLEPLLQDFDVFVHLVPCTPARVRALDTVRTLGCLLDPRSTRKPPWYGRLVMTVQPGERIGNHLARPSSRALEIA